MPNQTDNLFSVIVPCYNGQTYIAEAIASIVRQSHSNLEVLVVDDGSTDNSASMLAELRRRSTARFSIHRHPDGENHGIAASYELGIAKARGRYVAFLEQDDRWSPDYLQRKLAVFQEHPDVGVVFSPYRVVSQGWYGKDMALRQQLLRWKIPRNRPFDNFKHLLRFNNVASFSCFTVRAELLRDLQDVPEPSLLYYDWWLLLDLSTRTSFYFETDSVCFWRHSRRSALGRQAWEEHCERGVAFFRAMYELLETNSESLPEHKRLLVHGLRRDAARFLALMERRDWKSFRVFFLANPRWASSTLASLIVNYGKRLGPDYSANGE